jgi:hypothetical protein
MITVVDLGRWRSGRDRVESLPVEAGGRVAYEPFDSHVYLRSKLDAITVE